jgi:transposase-like protein
MTARKKYSKEFKLNVIALVVEQKYWRHFQTIRANLEAVTNFV